MKKQIWHRDHVVECRRSYDGGYSVVVKSPSGDYVASLTHTMDETPSDSDLISIIDQALDLISA